MPGPTSPMRPTPPAAPDELFANLADLLNRNSSARTGARSSLRNRYNERRRLVNDYANPANYTAGPPGPSMTRVGPLGGLGAGPSSSGVLSGLNMSPQQRGDALMEQLVNPGMSDISSAIGSAIGSASSAAGSGIDSAGGMLANALRQANNTAWDNSRLVPERNLETGEVRMRPIPRGATTRQEVEDEYQRSPFAERMREINQQSAEAEAQRRAQAQANSPYPYQFADENARNAAYRDAANTRFTGMNQDGTTFDRLPTDSEAAALADSSFRQSGRQFMPRITTNSTFPGQVNPNVGQATVRDPYGGQNKYAWQGRQTPQGNTTFRSVTRNPVTGQTTVDNFAVPNNPAPVAPPTLSPSVDPITGATIEAPQVAQAQQAAMDRIQRRRVERAQNVPYARNQQTWQNAANSMGIPTEGVDQRGNPVTIPDDQRRAMFRAAAKEDMQNKYAANNAAWNNIRANRQAQNAGFANAFQAQMFRDIMMANAARGNMPFIQVGGGQGGQQAAQGGRQDLRVLNNPPVVSRGFPTLSGEPRRAAGLTATQLKELEQMRDSGATDQQIRDHASQKFGVIHANEQNQIFYHLYPDGSRSANGPNPIGRYTTPDGMVADSANPFAASWRWLYDTITGANGITPVHPRRPGMLPQPGRSTTSPAAPPPSYAVPGAYDPPTNGPFSNRVGI